MLRTFLLALLAFAWTASHGLAQTGGGTAPRRNGPDPFDAVFVNANKVRMVLQADTIEIVTTYGKLAVPVKDVHAVEFGMRVPPEAIDKIAAAVDKLASRDDGERIRAAAALVELGPYSYRAVLRVGQANDLGMRQRAQDILKRLERKFSKVELTRSTEDVIVTPQMKIVGQITASSFKAKVEYFGDNTIQVAKLVSMRNTNVVKPITEQDRIQGTWYVTQIDLGGFRERDEMTFTFHKDQVHMGGERHSQPGSFKLGKLENLKTIDINLDGEEMIGIYEIEGDTMKMCLAHTNRGRGNVQRPTEFVGNPYTGQMVILMEKKSKE